MKLLYAGPSPYSRKVRIAIAERQLAGIEQIAVSPFELPAALVAANPLSKVPALMLDGGTALYDSPVICEYLDSLGEAPRLIPAQGPERWTTLRRQALADGILDATFAIACETMRRPENERSQAWINRWQIVIGRGLDAIEVEVVNFGPTLTLAHVSVACVCDYVDLRARSLIDWRDGHPQLARWFTEFDKRPSMQSTRA
jgi:glutathione S-transferase